MTKEELEKVRARIAEMRLRAATDPDFGKPKAKRKTLKSKKEKEEFKKWREMRKRGEV